MKLQIIWLISRSSDLSSMQLLVFYIVFVMLFLISSSLIADILRDMYSANWHKIPHRMSSTHVLTVSVVSACKKFQY